jgi:hypothetical protein
MTYAEQQRALQDAYEQSLFPRNEEAFISTDYAAFSTEFETEDNEILWAMN